MKDFLKNIKNDPKMYRAMLYSNFSAARINLLLVVIFSIINIVSLATGFGGYFLFCAAIPYQVVKIGMALCGMNSPEYYEQIKAQPIFDKPIFALFIIIALLILLLFFLCWLFSKKRGAEKWLGFALAMISADTMVALLLGSPSTWIVDILFHIVLIILLFSGIGAYKKLRALHLEEKKAEAEHLDDYPNGEIDEYSEGDEDSYVSEDTESDE